tara:strand:- start:51 stop:608 length:558 start_codon:yes stop_codon:yes gene_type:complete
MRYSEYLQYLDSTCVLPRKYYLYYATGLTGEVQEFCDDPSQDELGDVIWYFSVLHLAYRARGLAFANEDVQDAMPQNDNFIIDVASQIDLVKSAAELGQLLNKQCRKEYQRKDWSYNSETFKSLNRDIDEIKESIELKLGVMSWQIFKVAEQTNCLPLTEVFLENHIKLFTRFNLKSPHVPGFDD